MDGWLGCAGVIGVVFLGLTVVLPVSTFLRMQRLTKLVEQLRVRMSELEHAVTAVQHTSVATAPRSEATSVATPAVVAAGPIAPLEVPVVSAAPDELVVPRYGAARVSHDDGPEPEASAGPSVLTPPSPPLFTTRVTPPAASPAPASPAHGGDTLETTIGGQWFLYIGIAVVVLSVGFFVKYAFDNEWVNPTARVVLGALFGLAMVVAGHRFARRGYELYGHVVAGGGFVALYVAVWASLNLYALIPGPAAFGLMILITTGAALMADRLRSQALALVAVLGGFTTPALIGGPEDAQVVLLTYVAVLTGGTMLLAARRGWAWLNLLSYVLTVLVFFGWASTHYAASKYPTTQFYLALFGAMFGYAYWVEWRSAAHSRKFVAAVLLGSVVVLFHGASALNLFDHSLPLLLYLVAFTLVGVAASVRWDRAWLRLAVFLTTVPVFLGWLDTHNTPGWRIAIVATAVAFYVMHLAAQGERASRDSGPWERADLVLFHASALALFAALYRVVDVGWPYSTPALAIGLAVWQGVLAWWMRAASGEAAVNALAASFAMVGFAIGLQFDDWWALVGWAIEAGAIYWAGLRTRRAWMRWGGALLLGVVVGQVLQLDFFGTPAGFEAFWNPRAGSMLIIVAVIYAMSFFLRRALGSDGARSSREYALLLVCANVLTVMLISAEINSYWHLRSADDATASLWLLASLSVAWGVYGTGLVIVGIQRRYAPLRYLALVLLLLTVAKVFLMDLSELGGVYRIVGFMGLGVCLLLGAWLYQRFRNTILGIGD